MEKTRGYTEPVEQIVQAHFIPTHKEGGIGTFEIEVTSLNMCCIKTANSTASETETYSTGQTEMPKYCKIKSTKLCSCAT